MKILLTILCLSFFYSKGQTVTYDTSAWLIPVINGKLNNLHIADGRQYYYYGWIMFREEIINQKPVRTKVGYLAFDKKSKIPYPYIVNKLQQEIPLNGYEFKP